MRGLLAVLLVMVVGACSSRKVEVGTGVTPSSGVSLNVSNTLSQDVNVYVTSGGTGCRQQHEGAGRERRGGWLHGFAEGGDGRWYTHLHSR